MILAKVKICGVTRTEDALIALEEGADYIGFIFYEQSPRCVTLEQAQQLFEDAKVPSEKRVVVDVDPEPETLARRKEAGFSFFQIHFPENHPADRILSWSQAIGRGNLWLAPRLAPQVSFPEALLELSDTFLVDAFSPHHYGGTG